MSASAFVGVQVLVVLICMAGMAVSNTARSYVTGEALYSKAQKEAVIALLNYGRTGAEPAYRSFASSISVLDGDRLARQALERRSPDFDLAERAFLQGENAPEDVPALIAGFYILHRWAPFAAAVDDWRAADAPFLSLEALGGRVRQRLSASGPPGLTAEDLAEVTQLDRRLSFHERRFSVQMGRVAREVSLLAFALVMALSAAVCLVGVYLGWRVQRRLTQIGLQLAEARDQAEESSRAKGAFLANMSHEIRTPLTGILGYADLLVARRDLPEQAASHVDHIATAGRTLLSVVNDILDFSKIENGQLTLDEAPFDPAAFVAETVDLIRPGADAKGLQVQVVVEDLLPPVVIGDAARMRQILLNLLSNAIKFTSHGGVAVTVGYVKARGMLSVAVSDTGLGIPRERVDRLFRRFSQVDESISRQFGGTGLGLAICKSMTELMGGAIGVESVEGQGSTFRFTVVAPEADRVLAAPTQFEREDPLARSARILVVDDVHANRELVCTILAALGHELTQASSGPEAVETALTRPFDLILMDIQMPGMDGLAATRAIQQTSDVNRATPIVALSANVLDGHVDACRSAGMVDHIGKPIDARELLTKVGRWLVPTTEDASMPVEPPELLAVGAG